MRSVLHYARVVAGADQPQTQTSAAERQALCRHLPGRRTIVEVGVFEGFTTRLLAECADPGAVIYGVDPFFTGRAGISWGQLISRHHIGSHLRSGRVRLVRALSVEAGDAVPGFVDYVFIDADHSYEGLRADWEYWTGRLAPGGIVALHDAVEQPGAPKFGSHDFYVAEVKRDARFNLVEEVDSLAVLQKADAA